MLTRHFHAPGHTGTLALRFPAAPHPARGDSMRALFVGGTVDNSELDLEPQAPPSPYPNDTGHGAARNPLHAVGWREGPRVYAVSAAPELEAADVDRVVDERGYARRFHVDARDAHQ